MLWGWTAAVAGVELEGFTEPSRTVNVSSAETGVVAELLVREGQAVRAGEPLAQLDRELHEAAVAIAAAGKNFLGRKLAVQAEVDMRRQRVRKLEELLADGHARSEEVERARTDLAVAEGNLRAAEEDLIVKQLEHQRLLILLERRTLRAPIDGVVVTVLKQQGEFVAPNDPYLLTMVQLDPLVAVFSAASGQTASWKRGDRVRLKIEPGDKPIFGVIDYISPITDAGSGTVQIKVKIDNAGGALRSGERCRLLVDEPKVSTGSTASGRR